MSYHTDDWHRLCGQSWVGTLTPDAFCHPAKVSRALARRIYQHAIEEGWLQAGDTVLDPFAGIGGFALDAMANGLHFVGVELESRFVTLGQQNIALWNGLHAGAMPTWGTATILQGDSRELGRVVRGYVQAAIASPPYASGCQHTGGDDPHPERVEGGTYHGVGIQGAISSPPYAQSLSQGNDPSTYDYSHYGGGGQLAESQRYSHAPDNLGNLPEGDYQAAISSPPFASTLGKGGETKGFHSYDDNEAYNRCKRDYLDPDDPSNLGNLPEGSFDATVSSPPYTARTVHGNSGIDQGKLTGNTPDRNSQALTMDGYGTSPGQLGAMRDQDFDAVVSSPPFANSMVESGDPNYAHKFHGNQAAYGGSRYKLHNEYTYMSPEWIEERRRQSEQANLSRLPEQAETVQTFWAAARAIVEQTYTLLVPGGHAIFVVKDYVRDKRRVPFCDQWRVLCESVGFVTLHQHRAWVVEDNGTQLGFFEDQRLVKERKSFFRRLAEANGSPRIDYEVVWCMVKPSPAPPDMPGRLESGRFSRLPASSQGGR